MFSRATLFPLKLVRLFFRFIFASDDANFHRFFLPDVVFRILLAKEHNIFLRFWLFPARLSALLLFYSLTVFNAVFIPAIIFRQLFALIFFQTLYELSGFAWKHLRWVLWTKISETGRKALALRVKLSKATTFAEWKAANYELNKFLHSAEEYKTPDELKTLLKLRAKIASYKHILNTKTENNNHNKSESELGPKHKDNITDEELKILKNHLRQDLLRKHAGISDKNIEIYETVREYHMLLKKAVEIVALHEKPKYNDIAEELKFVRNKLAFFKETKQSFGNSALLLSGGAALGLLHVGVLKTLLSQKLLPKVVSGSSAGALVCAMLGSRTNAELVELFEPENLNLRFFGRSDSIGSELDKVMRQPHNGTDNTIPSSASSPKPLLKRLDSTNRIAITLLPAPLQSYFSLFRKLLPRYLDSKTLLDVDVLKTALRDIIGDITFLEAYEKTGRIINITVTPQSATQQASDSDFPQLLNYLTTPDVVIWSAAVASCSIPGVFAPVMLYKKVYKLNNSPQSSFDSDEEDEEKTKNKGKNKNETSEDSGSFDIVPCEVEGIKWTDGSIDCDLPIDRMREMFDVNHFIVSQVNPHARILAPHTSLDFYGFMPSSLAYISNNAWDHLGGVVMFLRDQIRSWLKHVANFQLKSPFLKDLGFGASPLLTQKYHGDITITPKIAFSDLSKLLRNPTAEEYKESIFKGEQMTWPWVSKIKRRCLIEFMLNDCITALTDREQQIEKVLVNKARVKKNVTFVNVKEREENNEKFYENTNNKTAVVTLEKLQKQLENRVISTVQLDALEGLYKSFNNKQKNKNKAAKQNGKNSEVHGTMSKNNKESDKSKGLKEASENSETETESELEGETSKKKRVKFLESKLEKISEAHENEDEYDGIEF